MKKSILAALLAGCAFAVGLVTTTGLLQAYSESRAMKVNDGGTTYGDIKVLDLKLQGSDIVDSGDTTRISIGSSNAVTGALAVSGRTTTTGGLMLQVSTGPRTNVTPSAAGNLIYNSTDVELCFSTGTAQTSWVKVSSGTALTPCGH